MEAFEIGIRLALDDEVSAGLELINRDLAAIDRAIASVNAGLLQLNQGSLPAETAAGPIGSTQTRKQVPAAAEAMPLVADPTSVGGAAAMKRPEPGAAAPAAREGARETDAVREVAQAPIPVREVVTGSSELLPSAGAAPEVSARTPAERESGPAPRVSEAQGRSEAASAPVPQARLANPEPVAPVSLPRASEEDGPSPLPKSAGGASPREPAQRNSVSALMTEIRLQRSSQRERHIEQHFRRDTARQEHAISRTYRTDGESGGARSEGRSSTETDRGASVAPTYDVREESSSVRGTVVLDGRLVGHWMSEQFARDASRPPSGPTFFDPRQSPAWTSSGAL